MTLIPLTILDNFIHNPDSIKNWALNLKYESEPLGRWPGKRSQPLLEIHPPFYYYVCNKVLSLFFEDITNLQFDIDLSFQLIENHQGKGWIHQDPGLFTFLIYFHESNPEVNCGTTLWDLKPSKIHPFNNQKDIENYNLKNKHYLNQPISSKPQQNHHENFIKNISIPDKYNRLIAFPSEQFHSANNFNNNLSPRLTLIGFVDYVNTPKFPVIRNKQITMF